jgi:hypothetical protein
VKESIILIETSDVGANDSAQAVLALGYEPIFLCDLTHYQADPLAQIKKHKHFNVNTENLEGLEFFVRRNNLEKNLVAVASFQDGRLDTAAKLAAKLNVLGLDPVVSKLKDKAFTFKLVPEYIPISISFKMDQVPVEEIIELLDIYQVLIAKPTHGAGGVGVLKLKTHDDVHRLPSYITKMNEDKNLDSGRWIVQAFASGPMFSLEGYVINGRTEFLGFTDRRKINATETGARFPIDHRLSNSVKNNAKRAVDILVNRSGFKNGYFHIEFIECEDSCHMIDPNIGRIGGGPIAQLLALSYGISPIEVFKHVLNVGLFRTNEINPYQVDRQRKQTESILYGLQSGGIIKDITLPDLGSCLHTRILGQGANVSAVGIDDWSWIGIMSGYAGEVESAVNKIKITTAENIEQNAFF